MTQAGQLYENPQTGERMRLLETARESGGLRLTIEFWLQPYTNRDAPAHFHRAIEEQFEILSGPVCYRLGKSEFAANPGEVVVLPPAVPHVHPWATSEQGAHLRQTLLLKEPDAHMLELMEQFLETVYALGQRHKLGRNGVPTNPLQTIVTLQAIQPAVYVAGLPVFAQRSLFGVLAAMGCLLGYRAFLPAHSSLPAGQEGRGGSSANETLGQHRD